MRIEPVLYPGEPETDRLLELMMPPDSPVPPLAAFRVLARNMRLSEAMVGVGSYVLGRGLSIPRRERELLIQRMCVRCGCDYEWGVHAVSWGERAGLTEDQLAATVHGDAGSPVWSERDALVVRLVDEVHETATVSDELWAALAEHWADHQLLDLVFVAAWYRAISSLFNAVELDPEPWAMPVPAR